ncbi:protein FAM161A [Brienomyrus brachyistius]|uniref:protein FAM161A n=1 Tax=Brienomyrus brachyistius TaxID=42636 RepID=UPI0020B36938|nr:protein FAM161A [Brienomyrus brachyistius]
MDNLHRTNVIVTSCLRPPVKPKSKAPLALYEREREHPHATGRTDTRNYEKELVFDGDDGGGRAEDRAHCPLTLKDCGISKDHFDLREFCLSNEEYYRKLEELKQAHLQTMAELEGMYRHKLDIKDVPPVDGRNTSVPHRSQWTKPCSVPVNLHDASSAQDLDHYGSSGMSGTSEDSYVKIEPVMSIVISPKEKIKNMWQDFIIGELTPRSRSPSCSSPRNQLMSQNPGVLKDKTKGKEKRTGQEQHPDGQRLQITVPKPFRMTLREAEKKQRIVRSRSEVELENAMLRKQLEELTECQKKFHASPVPAHVYLPLYEEICERNKERRILSRQQRPTSQKPFSFLERECRKREQKVQLPREEKKAFRARPVPRKVYNSTVSERLKEDQLYRAIKMQMRAQELLHSASMPCSMLARRLSNRRRNTEEKTERTVQAEANFQPKINREVPDFDASYRRFRKRLQDKRNVKLLTVCEPFHLRTAQIPSRQDRIQAAIEAELESSRVTHRPYRPQAQTVGSSLCSSFSSSLELLPSKITDAAKKRQEAVRRALEQRREAEEEEDRWREKQRQRERKLQKVISRRALANDPHTALSQICPTKLKQFRTQDRQRRKEYGAEMREIQKRVEGRPLLLEQVTLTNAKLAAEKRFAEALRGYGLSQDIISYRASGHPLSEESLSSASFTDKLSNKNYDAAGSPAGAESFPDGYPEDFDRELSEGEEGEMHEVQKGTEEEDKRADQSELQENEDETKEQYLEQEKKDDGGQEHNRKAPSRSSSGEESNAEDVEGCEEHDKHGGQTS